MLKIKVYNLIRSLFSLIIGHNHLDFKDVERR